MKSKLLNFVLIFGLILSLFTGCDGDANEQLLNGAGTEPIVKVTYTQESKSRKLAPEPVTVTIKVPSRVVLESFLEDNDIDAKSVTGLEFYGIREIQGNDNNGKTFASCEKLGTVFMDESLTDIGEYAFYQLPNGAAQGTVLPIEKLVMSGVENIGKYAFNGCNQLKEVTFPETIKLIGEKAFHGCEEMKTVVFTGKTAPSIAEDAFNSEKVEKILVPKGSKESYQNALTDTLKTKVSDEDKRFYTITFDSNGGSEVASQTVKDGECATMPVTNPTKDGFVFVNWCSDEALNVEYDFNTPVTRNITLYANWSALPFKLVAQEDGVTVKINKSDATNAPAISLVYRQTDGTGWTEWTDYTWDSTSGEGIEILLSNNGDEVEIKAKEKNEFFSSGEGYYFFVLNNKVAAKGSIMYLIDSAGKSTEVPENCFRRMFEGCTSLTTAPELPAITLASHCYEYMFSGCSALTTAPELVATTLENCDYCYNSMFLNCTSLETTPDLSAEMLAKHCYDSMFSGCTSLTTVPEELPAETLANYCYSDMFSGCRSLTTAPELPAQNLAENCYQSMFGGCTGLTEAPVLSATTLEKWCYYNMFNGCTALTEAPELPATELVDNCYYQMFKGCNSLNKIKVGFITTDWASLPENATKNWLDGVASSGTFICPAGLSIGSIGSSYIPSGWAAVTPGIFSVSAEKKVQFTKGNLIYSSDDGGKFIFDAQQYNYPTGWSATYLGHFFFSTSASVACASTYSESSTSVSDILFTNDSADISKPNSTFTVNGITGKYRSLSADEWTYLMNTRTASKVGTTEKARFARVKINTDTTPVDGLLIFPDAFTWTADMGEEVPSSINYGNEASSYSSGNFKAMEAAGCVFIPAAGYRYNGSFGGQGSTGRVWTASSHSSDVSKAAYFGLASGISVGGDFESRSYGLSIRLVKDVE